MASVPQQCNLVTPLQLYFTYRQAIEKGQVRKTTGHCAFSTSPE
jgi:hypothetical protein